MSDSSRIRVSIVAESSYGVTPTTPNMLVLPITGHSMQDRIGYQQSNIIRSDRNVADLVRMSKSAGGGIPCELLFSPASEGLRAALAAMLCSTFSAAVTINSLDYVGGTNNVTRASGSFISDSIEVGDIIRQSNYTGQATPQYRRVTTVSALSLTFAGNPLGATDDAAISITRGARCKNGTLTPSYTIEIAHLDLQLAHIFTGCVFNIAEIGVQIQQLATISFSIEAQGSTRVGNTGTPDQFIAGATYPGYTSHPTLNPIDVYEIVVSGETYAAAEVSVSWNNGARGREQLGTLGLTSIARGPFAVTGRVRSYLVNFDDHDDFADNTETDLWLAVIDANNRGYSVSYPQSKLSNVNAPVSGNNADVYKNVELQAFLDPTELCTVRLQVWGD
jgi:hypothetical protein